MDISVKITMPDLKTFDGNNYVTRLAEKQRRESIPALKLMFQQTVDGWEHRPTFEGKQTIASNSITMEVFPTGPHAELYSLVSKGSPPHAIYPKQTGGLLRFQPGYRSATNPRILSSRAKQRSGAFVTSPGIDNPPHPGFEGREFPETISDLFYPVFLADMQDAMKP